MRAFVVDGSVKTPSPRSAGRMSKKPNPRPPLLACASASRGARLGPRVVSLALIAIATVATYWPTLRNSFLAIGFDDTIVLDTLAIRQLSWANLRALATDFNQAHYVPLTMFSLAVDYYLWGPNPFGYHLTNVLLHAATSVLATLMSATRSASQPE